MLSKILNTLLKMWGKALQKSTRKTIDTIALLITAAVINIAITIVSFSMAIWLLNK